MKCDLRCGNINVYFDIRDLPVMWKDFKNLRHVFKHVRWYWKPVWLVLHTISFALCLVMLALIFSLFGVYVMTMVFGYGALKITLQRRDFANERKTQ